MNAYLENYEKAFNLVTTLIESSERDKGSKEKLMVDKIEKFIQMNLIEFMKEDSPSHSAALFYDFIYEFNRFREFVVFTALAKKNIVGLGGAFSSGKSSFLNSIFGKEILPAKLAPTISVPSYVIHGESLDICAINIFNQKVHMDEEALKAVSHDFTERYGVGLGHIIKSIFIQIPQHEFHNIAFLDTPGYSKAHSEYYSVNTDEKLARAQLNTSNFIIWFVDAEGGTIKEEDISFLQSLRKDIPILIIVSRADKKTKEDIESIVKETKNRLKEKALFVVDVIPYSARKPAIYPADNIIKYLRIWNDSKIQLLFAKNFKMVFSQFEKYFEDSLEEEKGKLNKLNSSIVLLDKDQQEVEEYLSFMRKDVKSRIKDLKERKEKLQAMRTDFFTILKATGDQVGIPLPEPKDIDLIVENFKDPIIVLQEYKNKNALKTLEYSGRIKFKFDTLNEKKAERRINNLSSISENYGSIIFENLRGVKIKDKVVNLEDVIFEKLKKVKVKDRSISYGDVIINKFNALDK